MSATVGRRLRIGAAIAVAAAIGVGLGLGVHSLIGGPADAGAGIPLPQVRGQAVWPQGVRKAPEFSLLDSHSKRFTLASLRGEPVVIVFMDSRCHQECPLIGRALAAGFKLVPKRDRPTVVAVSVDPWEDTPGSVQRAIKRFGLSGFRWRWLLGTKAQLAPIWRKYRIQVRRTPGDVEHTDALYLVDSKGYERAGMVYPFLPTWVATDLKTLAAESG
ncbi:MAG: SCO family protein [Actinobacteria bacterium]|nr:SCO family protein [Actinomycetota bacterium]